ncbi:hypothetical protein EV356DRAFT_299708 [Viridothelium virens]|uniref:Uncharacterized protein n=1 Tax=Viridothelium virens TaxID=1048519 RepID=A0A6A6H059_VIRVR|nr:hypothetical protein EV356DRAFT_299708 [Viridothelium virens]
MCMYAQMCAGVWMMLRRVDSEHCRFSIIVLESFISSVLSASMLFFCLGAFSLRAPQYLRVREQRFSSILDGFEGNYFVPICVHRAESLPFAFSLLIYFFSMYLRIDWDLLPEIC